MQTVVPFNPDNLMEFGGHFAVDPQDGHRYPKRVWRTQCPDALTGFESDAIREVYATFFGKHGDASIPVRYIDFLDKMADCHTDKTKPPLTLEEARLVFSYAWNQMMNETVANEPFPVLEVIKKEEGEPSSEN